MSTVPYADYKSISTTQAGAGTTSILGALAANTNYEIVHVAIEVQVANAGGTWKIETSGNVEMMDGLCIITGRFSRPVGKFVADVDTETIDLVVGTGGTVTAHILYKIINVIP